MNALATRTNDPRLEPTPPSAAPGPLRGPGAYFRNDLGNQFFAHENVERPSSPSDLAGVVARAAAAGKQVRAVGGGYAFGDLVQTPHVLVRTSGLDTITTVSPQRLCEPGRSPALIEVGAGVRLSSLARALDARGRALANLPAFHEVTLAGALATSTHGSGLGLGHGGLGDQVESVLLVDGKGQLLRVEPSLGISDPAEHGASLSARGIRLIQDDNWFHAVTTGVGCAGLIGSVILRTVPQFWLRETRRLTDLATLRAHLDDPERIRRHRAFEILVNPYRLHAPNACLDTERAEVPRPANSRARLGHRPLLLDAALSHPASGRLLRDFVNRAPTASPFIIQRGLEGLVGSGYTDRSHHVYDLGRMNCQRVLSSEYAFPLARAHEAFTAITELAARLARDASVYFNLPMSLRFAPASSAHLSLAAGTETVYFELLFAHGTRGARAALLRYEETLLSLGGRPHWGQMSTFPAAPARLDSHYPQLPTFRAVRHAIDPEQRFCNDYVRRAGLCHV